MIRRLFWLVLGAVLGVTGYRRATRRLSALLRLGRSGPRTATAPARADQAVRVPVSARGEASSRAQRRGWAMAREVGLSASGFLRDAREGMEDYLDRHAGERGPKLGVQQVRHGRADEAGSSRRYTGIDHAKGGH